MIEKHIQTLNANPFFGAMIIQAFYKGFGKAQCSIVLHYTILPMIFFGETRKSLSIINIRTDLSKFVELNKVSLLDLQVRIEQFKNLTNQTLIYLHNHNKIKLDSEVSIIEPLTFDEYSDDMKIYLRASHYFGYLLANEEISTVFKNLNVIL